jgi:hypothetical protein
MNDNAFGTLPRAQKGPIAPAPILEGPLQTVIDAVASWPGVTKTVHWHFSDHSRMDGVDFYVADDELGHVHLHGEVHLATSQQLGNLLIVEGAAKPFRYQEGWVEEDIRRIGTAAAVALFRRNYDRLVSRSEKSK